MKSIHKFLMDPEQCHYLPDRNWRLEYNFVSELSESEYSTYVRQGWRKFGRALFRPRCPSCRACQPIRVITGQFEPSRSQKRILKKNSDLRLEIGDAQTDRNRAILYLRHHSERAQSVDWPHPTPESAVSHMVSMSDNPFPIQQWCFYLGDDLIALCYVDPVDDGLSAVYSFYEPVFKSRSLGTYMVLSMIEHAIRNDLPYVYLGYYIKGCRSMSYKANFQPNEVLNEEGDWVLFASRK